LSLFNKLQQNLTVNNNQFTLFQPILNTNMYSTAHQAATRPSSHNEDEVSEGARRDFRPDHQTTLKCNAAHSDACGQTESESERAGPSSNRTRKKKSVSASSDPACATRTMP